MEFRVQGFGFRVQALGFLKSGRDSAQGRGVPSLRGPEVCLECPITSPPPDIQEKEVTNLLTLACLLGKNPIIDLGTVPRSLLGGF